MNQSNVSAALFAKYLPVIAQPTQRRWWGAIYFGYDPEGNQFGVVP